MTERQTLRQARDYLEEACGSGISRVDDVVERDAAVARAIVRSYARMTSSQGKITEMLSDIHGQGFDLSESSLRSYISALRKIFVLEDLQAWNPNLRSKTAVRTAPTRHFSDPSIASAALRISPGDLMGDLETFGLFFESLCVRDLRVYAAALDGDVYHYRDRSGLEADAVLHLRSGPYALIEAKLGGESLVDEGGGEPYRPEGQNRPRQDWSPNVPHGAHGCGRLQLRACGWRPRVSDQLPRCLMGGEPDMNGPDDKLGKVFPSTGNASCATMGSEKAAREMRRP